MKSVDQQFSRLVEIMAVLRSEKGCPWDLAQNHKSLRQHLLEETYEVLETIDDGQYEKLPDELGDLLLQVIFHAQIASDEGLFNIGTVLQSIINKLIRRHPHVFGDKVVETAEEQIILWEQTKINKEGKKSAIDGVPKQLPALVRSYRLQNKAAAVGFDWKNIEPVWDKVSEELTELQAAVTTGQKENIEDELGDLLFTIVNLARFLKVNPEDALRKTIKKFDSRFRKVEQDFKDKGLSLSEVSLEEMDNVWEKVKKQESD